MPIATPPKQRAPGRSTQRSPYDKRRSRRDGGSSSRKRSAKGARKLPKQGSGRDGWRPPTPETDPPLPPAPLLNPATSGILAGTSFLWGLLNPPTRGPVAPTPGTNEAWTEGEKALDAAAMLTATIRRSPYWEIKEQLPPNQCKYETLRPAATSNAGPDSYDGSAFWTLSNFRTCNYGTWKLFLGRVGKAAQQVLSLNVAYPYTVEFTAGAQITFARVSGNTQPLPGFPQPAIIPRPVLPPFEEPEQEEETAPLRRPLAPPLPTVAPPLADPATDPEAPPDPTTEPEPAPETQPTTRPRPVPLPLTPSTKPLFPPAPTKTDAAGKPIAPRPGPTPQTGEGIEDFLGKPIGQPEQAPPPTLEGIAREVGRIEQKLGLMAGGVGQSTQCQFQETDLSEVLALCEDIRAKLAAEFASGSYQLEGPCEPVQPGGQSVTRTAAWQSGSGSFNSILARVDALAQLLQHHKSLRQPICRQKASGEEVTVIFEEI